MAPPKQKPGRSEQSVGTPPEFLIAVLRLLEIDAFAFDLAATRGINNVALRCFTAEDDALAQDWADLAPDGYCWLNPPYDDIARFLKRAAGAGCQIAVLIPASIGANWWVEHVEGKAEIVPLHGRITFIGHTDAYPKDCALLLYGPGRTPGYRPAWRWMDLLTAEELNDMRTRTGKAPKAPKATQGDKVRPISEGRRKRRTPPPEEPGTVAAGSDVAGDKPSDPTPLGRVTTFKPNGGSSMQPAPDPIDVGQGEILIPEPEDAERGLRELAVLNDRAQEAKSRWDVAKERAKDAKENYDTATEAVLTRLRQLTHKTDLPLFADVDRREQDQARMEAAGSAAGDVDQVGTVAEVGSEVLPDASETDVTAPESDDQALPEVAPGELAPVEAVQPASESAEVF